MTTPYTVQVSINCRTDKMICRGIFNEVNSDSFDNLIIWPPFSSMRSIARLVGNVAYLKNINIQNYLCSSEHLFYVGIWTRTVSIFLSRNICLFSQRFVVIAEMSSQLSDWITRLAGKKQPLFTFSGLFLQGLFCGPKKQTNYEQD